ncbi:MAG: hypothetical protein IPL32_14735 [Chloracidobacterium sp.]|nr:hypothetical protein [Chloracidobacterium sp.]
MNTDNPKSLLEVALNVRKEHQDELEKTTAEPEMSEVKTPPIEEPSEPSILS